MPAPKRVLCVMDLSLVGRAGLAAVVPVLAACGVQACCLPTTLLSTHTGGFGPVAHQDEAVFCQKALDHFVRQQVVFEAIYIGYLCGDDQFALAEAVLEQYPQAYVVVDPAMADGGHLYTGLPQNTPQRMMDLCRRARLVTPNGTESGLLLGQAPSPSIDEATARRRLEALCGAGQAAVITSVATQDGCFSTWGRTEDGEVFAIPSTRVPQQYPGTGDLFCAALCGRLLGGQALPQAAKAAADFVEAAARRTFAGGGEPRHGLWFEPELPMLADFGA